MNTMLPFKKPNRPDPLTKFPVKRPSSSVEVHDDGRVSLHYISLPELMRIRTLAEHDIHLFGLCWHIDQEIADRTGVEVMDA